jgi:integrase/recombinase XerD
MELVTRNPVRYIEKPTYEARDQIISLAEYHQILGHTRDEAFRDLLVVHWETGCRPQESVRVEARHVDLANRRWVFPAKEAKGKRAPRIVYLTEVALEITRRRMEKNPQGPLFRNNHGVAWHPWAVSNRFGRIQAAIGKEVMVQKGLDVAPADIEALIPKLKLTRMVTRTEIKKTSAELRAEAKQKLLLRETRKHGTRYCLYAFRHTFATRMLRAGVDALTVALLLGHRDVSMLGRVYQHLSFQPQHFQKQLQSVSASS